MNRVDRAPGVRLVTDSPHVRPAPPEQPPESFDFEWPERPGLRALEGRLYGGLAVQSLVDLDTGETFITLVLNGETETFPVPADRVRDAFLHPFAYGATLDL